jgi:hypothetical protein
LKFEWDVTKARVVLSERGIAFEDAALALIEGDVLLAPSPRGSEDRHVGLVQINGKVWAVVHLWRGDTLRIITARRARVREENAYREFVAGRVEGAPRQE